MHVFGSKSGKRSLSRPPEWGCPGVGDTQRSGGCVTCCNGPPVSSWCCSRQGLFLLSLASLLLAQWLYQLWGSRSPPRPSWRHSICTSRFPSEHTSFLGNGPSLCPFLQSLGGALRCLFAPGWASLARTGRTHSHGCCDGWRGPAACHPCGDCS